MLPENPRTKRIAYLIQRNLAAILQREIDDPRLALVSISAVRISRDMSNAKIYFTLITKNKHKHKHQIADVEKAFNQANSFIRYLLSQRIELRIIPKLNFYYDVSIEQARKISTLIDTAIAEDPESP